MKVIILAAGKGSRLGTGVPKCLTPLNNGKTILQNQVDNLRSVFGSSLEIVLTVGFRYEEVQKAHPQLTYVLNSNYLETNTAKSLLLALKENPSGDYLFINGDVYFEEPLVAKLNVKINQFQSFICVSRAQVGDEEIKYTLDKYGNIDLLSKSVTDGLGEAVGINYVTAEQCPFLVKYLDQCEAMDYFEKGIELGIQDHGLKFEPLEITEFFAKEIDFPIDLDGVNEYIDIKNSVE